VKIDTRKIEQNLEGSLGQVFLDKNENTQISPGGILGKVVLYRSGLV
jgi:hypothetical protein